MESPSDLITSDLITSDVVTIQTVIDLVDTDGVKNNTANTDVANTSVNNEKVKNIISNIIKVPVNDSWEILDSVPDVGLYLVHYKKDSNMHKYGHIRGLIIDINEKLIVCSAYKYTPVIRSDELKPINDKLEFMDDLGNKYVGNMDDIKIVPGFEVVTIRVFLYKGKVYYSTYRKIDVWNSGSKWGDSIEFDKMAIELGIQKQDLFPNKNKLYSNYAHVFMLVHDGILNVTKADIKNGYIVYGGVKQLWNIEDISISDKDLIDTSPVNIDHVSDIEQAKNGLGILKPEYFNLNQANLFLKYGYYPNRDQIDDRLNSGEFVIVYLNGTSDQFNNVLRIESSSYRWRSIIKDDHPNLKFRFYQLLNMCNNDLSNPEVLNNFKSLFPSITKYNINSIIEKLENGYIHFWPNVNNGNVLNSNSTFEDKMYNIWACFIMTVPLCKQKYAASLYNEYYKNKKMIAETLHEIFSNENCDKIQEEMLNHRTFELIKLAKNFALRSLNNTGVNLINTTVNKTFDDQFKYNIGYLLNNEEGGSIYRIYKDCMKYKLTTV